ncbi:MAG: dipicolinate synthase subunit B [Lachnospiraceae bacterium]|nr:dipicolinate synthase subunit B [Lachnospiraceae bacterium]
MNLSGKTIGFAITGSFCTFAKIKGELMHLMEEDVNVIPIFSFNAYSLDTRFGKADEFVNAIESITKNKAIHTIAEAEKFGPKKILDILLIAPCTGNTMGKLVNGITDTPVLMAAKGHLRNQLPVVISLSTNDALGMNFKNIGSLMNIKNLYFVPFGQDDCKLKPNSLIAHTDLIIPALESALDGKQIQPIIRSPF